MAKKPKPHWQPISALPLLAESVDGMLESAEEGLPVANGQDVAVGPVLLSRDVPKSQ